MLSLLLRKLQFSFCILKLSVQLIQLLGFCLYFPLKFTSLLLILFHQVLVLALKYIADFLLSGRHILSRTLSWIVTFGQILSYFLLNNLHSFFYQAVRLGSLNTDL